MFQQQTIYIKVSINRFDLRHIESGKIISISAVEPFTTERLLIGQFHSAEKALNDGIKQITGHRLMASKPRVLIQPREKIEGGLSEVEERVLLEVATAAGAKEVKVWVGHELPDHEVIGKIKKPNG